MAHLNRIYDVYTSSGERGLGWAVCGVIKRNKGGGGGTDERQPPPRELEIGAGQTTGADNINYPQSCDTDEIHPSSIQR